MGERASGSYSVGVRRREEIVRIATRLFAQNGYAATSIAAIAQAAGISEGGMAHHFATKNSLLQAVAEQRIVETAAWWATLPKSDSALAMYDEMVAATKRFTEEAGLIELFVMSIAESVDPSSSAHTSIAARYDAVIGGIEQRLLKAVAAGEIRADIDARAIAAESIAVSDGFQMQWALSNGAFDLAARIADYSARMQQYLKA